MVTDWFAVLVLVGVALRASVATPVDYLEPYSWSERRLIRAIEHPAKDPRKAGTAARVYQLIDNLPAVTESTPPPGSPPGEDVNLLPQPEACGDCAPGTAPQPAEAGMVSRLMRNKFISARTVARTAALPGQFPWHASVLNRDVYYACSGALVSEQWVLTAANCAHGYDVITVRIGSYHAGADNERFQTTVNATHIVLHPGYRKGSPKDDIAAIRLPAPVKVSAFTVPVRLPSRNSFSTTYEGRDAWLSGWGFTSRIGILNSTSAVLGHALEHVISNEECSKSFYDVTTSSILCTTTHEFTGGCGGNSGAPLVVNEGGIFVQIGILSFVSDKGCTAGSPAGYTRVTAYMRWIQNVTGIAAGPDID